jgi:hypothetical protein
MHAGYNTGILDVLHGSPSAPAMELIKRKKVPIARVLGVNPSGREKSVYAL